MRNPTAADLARKLRKGTLDPVALVEEAFAKNESVGDRAIFTELLRDRAVAEARAARRRLKAGSPASLLDGVPMAWKDLFDVKGRVTTAGSVVLKSNPPASADAALVAAARAAGLVSVGCLNMTEFAYSGIGLNPHYGTPRNPNDKSVHRSPGGSSSASGVVVAAGIVPIAIGTDTGGSIRIPASFNGVVGYKSSTGHFPMEGVFPLSRTLDTLGPLAHTVEDCVLADAVLRGLKKPAVKARAPRGLEILVPTDVVFDGAEAAVVANFEASLSRLRKAGAKVKRITMPVFQQIIDLIAKRGHLLGAEALAVHWDRVKGKDAKRMDARVVKRILMADSMTAVDLVVVTEERKRMVAETAALIGNAVVAFPTTPHVAMPIAPLAADQDVFFRNNAKTLRNTMLGNFLDWCGVSIPNGTDSGGMPTGFLFSAPHGRDADVLAVGLGTEDLIRRQ
ncbi:amidase [Aestuariivirga sp.]|jgi:aspartyl-tRNA(Asn)/glutamyl-tRNA(Gln) amidotransferase subunit A|uniref:amidase n=1 Tax=Aestuariivirga sp. TaxID=2650926 RepID=UPI0037851017